MRYGTIQIGDQCLKILVLQILFLFQCSFLNQSEQINRKYI